MTGINGKNNLENTLIFFDSSLDLNKIREIQKTQNTLIISMDFLSFDLLKRNKISHIISDDFLTKKDMTLIQKTAYKLSDWYKEEQFSQILKYKSVNVGSLIQSELINILVNFLKKFYTVYKISQRYQNHTFICSNDISNIIQIFSKKFIKIKSKKNIDTLPLDSLNTNLEFGFKKFNLKFKVGTKKLNSLKSFTEKFSNSLIKPELNYNSKSFLFSELNVLKFSALFQKMSYFEDNYIIYNRRQPLIWNKESLSIFKNSKALLENENTLRSTIKSTSNDREVLSEKFVNNLKIHDNILTEFFTINSISFWVAFKQIFFNLLTKRFFENYYEIDLAKELLEKYSFAGIILQNEIGPNEQILIQLAKIRNIPIYLMQHGLIFDTTEAIIMNKYQGVLGINSDYQLVWGDVDFQYRKNMEFNSEKIIKIGSPIFDNLANNENSEKNYILLTTSGPTKEAIFDLTVETIQKNIDAIEKIAQIITSMNHKLVIKIHPSPDEFDPTELVKKIDPKIEVIKTGCISKLIKKCALMITIDFSSVILDSYLLKKPVISVPVKNNNYGSPKSFTDNSCIISTLDSLENSIKKILNDKKRYYEITEMGRNSALSYLSNQGNASDALLSFLSGNKNLR